MNRPINTKLRSHLLYWPLQLFWCWLYLFMPIVLDILIFEGGHLFDEVTPFQTIYYYCSCDIIPYFDWTVNNSSLFFANFIFLHVFSHGINVISFRYNYLSVYNNVGIPKEQVSFYILLKCYHKVHNMK